MYSAIFSAFPEVLPGYCQKESVWVFFFTFSFARHYFLTSLTFALFTSAACPRFTFSINAALRIFQCFVKTLEQCVGTLEDSVSCAQGDQALCCTHSEAGTGARRCVHNRLVLLAPSSFSRLFFSNWQLGPAKLWPGTAPHQVIQVQVLCAGPCFVLPL